MPKQRNENFDQKVELLKVLMLEDRTEVRQIKDKINNYSTLITVSSFAITAFFLSERGAVFGCCTRDLLVAADALLLCLLIALVQSLRTDLKNVRACVEMRQDLLMELMEGRADTFEPFQDANQYWEDPKRKFDGKTREHILDRDQNIILGASVGVIVIELLVTSLLFR